jgi:hypothetical protein
MSTPTIALRGQNYRCAMASITPALVARAKGMITCAGCFTPRMIAELAREFQLPCKTACEFLEHAEVLPTGTWERLPQRTRQQIWEARRVAP